MQYVFFCIWYLSWNIVLLRYISVAACFGLAKKSFFFFFFFCKIKDTFFIFSNNFLDLDFYLFMYLFIFNFYCYSITVICLFSQSLHPTPAEPTSLPHLHPPPWFCPCVLYSSFCNPLSSLSPPHSPLAIVRLFLTSLSCSRKTYRGPRDIWNDAQHH